VAVPSGVEVYIAPGQTREFVDLVGTLDEIRGATELDTLYFSAALTLKGEGSQRQTTAYPAGAFSLPDTCPAPCGGPTASSELEGWNSSLQVSVSYEVDDTHLWATVMATNTGQDTLRGKTGDFCAWWFRAYDDPTRRGMALWVQENAKDTKVCYQGLLELSLAPGDTFEFRQDRVGMLAELGALRPGGTLYFAAALRFDNPDKTQTWTKEFAAGSFTP